MQTSDADLMLAKGQTPAYGTPDTAQFISDTRNRDWASRKGAKIKCINDEASPWFMVLYATAKAKSQPWHSQLGNRRTATT